MPLIRMLPDGVVYVCLASQLLAALVSGCSRSHGTLLEPSLVLELERSVPVPADRQVTGVAMSPSGRLIAWHADENWVGLLDGEGPHQGGTPQVDTPVAVAVVDGWPEVVQSDGALVCLDWALTPVSHGMLRSDLDPVATAARGAGAWQVGGWMRDGSWAVFRVGVDQEVFRIDPGLAGDLGARLSGGPSEVTATLVGRPFRSWRIGRDLGIEPLEAIPSPQGDSWYSLPTLSVHPGWLQVISDHRSDSRVLVSYDQDGRMIRSTVLSVALGFVASDAAKRSLVGMRDLGSGRKEVVVDRWRWDPEGSP